MAYVPDSRDVDAPADDELASTAPAEFRALKKFLMELALAEHETPIDAATESFNAYTKPGLFRVIGATRLPGGNAPNGATSGTGSLMVLSHSLGAVQIFFCTAPSTPLMQLRFFTSPSTWGSWVAVSNVSAADLISALGYTPCGVAGVNAIVDSNWEIFVKGVYTATSNGYGSRTVSVSAPSGGADGDIWLQVV